MHDYYNYCEYLVLKCVYSNQLNNIVTYNFHTDVEISVINLVYTKYLLKIYEIRECKRLSSSDGVRWGARGGGG